MSALSVGKSSSSLVVIDTNVLLDWFVFRDPRVAPLVLAVTHRQLTWISCPPMRSELAQMLASLSLARWEPDAAVALAMHDELAHMRPAPSGMGPRPICSDADDQIFIDLAVEQQARWLLTQDRALLKLARRLRRERIEVASPGDWSVRWSVDVDAPRHAAPERK